MISLRRAGRRLFCCLCVAGVLLPAVAAAATLPSGFSEALVANGLTSPTAMQFAPDGRLFISEQAGKLRVVKNGALLPTPFVSLAFGGDGKLYVAVGENANSANAQSMNTVLGKILRINHDGTIPSDNPFFGSTTGKNRAIWALGLRNPFTFAFNHPVGTQLYINDVGQNTWEEIDDGIAGANYGWPDTEGATTDPRFVSPIYAYDHSAGACAITGGAFYVPMTTQFPTDYVPRLFLRRLLRRVD